MLHNCEFKYGDNKVVRIKSVLTVNVLPGTFNSDIFLFSAFDSFSPFSKSNTFHKAHLPQEN